MSTALPTIKGAIKPVRPALPAFTWPAPVASFAGGAAAISLITVIAYRLHLNLATAAFLHLIVVVLLARHSGFWAASSVSIVAVVSQTYFLVPPYLSFVVADSHNLIALATFGYCALTVSRLSSTATRQTQVAENRRRDTEGLYEISRLVLLMDRRLEPGPQIAAMIPRVFDCETVAIFDSASAAVAWAGRFHAGLEGRTRDAYLKDNDEYDAEQRTWVRVLRVDNRPVGALALRGGEMGTAVANALASLVAVAMERQRSFEKESRVEAARQSEQLRTAVLDALAHDVKTPLTAIRAASSGLIEAHVLDPLHEELVALIDNESSRLEEITNRLLRLARLDARDVRVKRGRLAVERLLDQTVAPARERAPDRIIRSRCATEGLAVLGDEQLLSMALSQLIDNALKYSKPDSGMTIAAERKGTEAVISVHNFGIPIPEADLDRIFERFYRSRDAHRVSGTGLGLSITRKIALAHGGRVWASSDEARGTTFYLSLPLTEDQAK
jgi:two-component system sensor histidine kinase KdpD